MDEIEAICSECGVEIVHGDAESQDSNKFYAKSLELDKD